MKENEVQTYEENAKRLEIAQRRLLEIQEAYVRLIISQYRGPILGMIEELMDKYEKIILVNQRIIKGPQTAGKQVKGPIFSKKKNEIS